MGKIFAIGDIHGCRDKLDNLMEKIPIDPRKDILVFIGDYIDRGPDSRGVIDSILKIREAIDHVVCLRGNHEEMFLNYHLERRDEEMFMGNGGLKTLISYGFMQGGRPENIDVPESHMRFFSELPLFHETEHYIFVHAGMRPGIPLALQNEDDLLWIRSDFIKSEYDFGKTVIFGHTPTATYLPHVEKYKIGIDTGAVFGGKLTCFVLPDMTIHQV